MANHEEQDHQSLMLHTDAIRMMQEDPALIACALSTLERWERMESKSHPSFVEWRRILLERDWDAALSTSELGNQIRQSSPVGCVLPEEKRLEIIWECRGDKSKFTKEEWFRQIKDANEKLLTKNHFV